MRSTALTRIAIGVVVERRKAKSPWLDFLWRPIYVLVGTPSATPWTQIGEEGGATTFYAGEAAIELHRTETANYRDNLSSGTPALWVVLRPRPTNSSRPAFNILMVTADPSEGEALTDAGNDLVATVPMPASIIETIERFIAEHHVERPFNKRQRDRGEPRVPGHRSENTENGK
ncbi:DUF3305 domain-containing protein [Bradyrhizobium sp. SRL28]|uniref:DUF3305 domain-containing protein n=1 Tax=Bradyrhizobium sp. SRL28 TaxID=2836178 RepID=UPI0027DF9796|nr:DUF3305 domain-containing protein [Bradyrhizobium sp. SRL28]